MITKKIFTVIIIFCLLFSLYTISDFSPKTVYGTDVSGTWVGQWNLTDSPFIVTENVTIPPHGALKIMPGVVVKFDPGTSLIVEGELNASGTTSQRITFTSNLATPTIGSWHGIIFKLTGRGIVANSEIKYAQDGVKGYSAYFMRVRSNNI